MPSPKPTPNAGCDLRFVRHRSWRTSRPNRNDGIRAIIVLGCGDRVGRRVGCMIESGDLCRLGLCEFGPNMLPTNRHLHLLFYAKIANRVCAGIFIFVRGVISEAFHAHVMKIGIRIIFQPVSKLIMSRLIQTA